MLVKFNCPLSLKLFSFLLRALLVKLEIVSPPNYQLLSRIKIMRTATSNLVIITTEITNKSITGLAMDSNNNIDVKFAVSNTDVNRAIFIPEANLVVTGNFRIARDICTIGIYVKSVIAVVSLPVPELEAIPMPEVVEAEVLLTPAQKSAATRAAKKAAQAALLVTV
jgi:hypothetical protein